MKITFEVESKTGANVELDQISFDWRDMIDFVEWVDDNDECGVDGLTLANYLSEKYNIDLI